MRHVSPKAWAVAIQSKHLYESLLAVMGSARLPAHWLDKGPL